MHVGAVQELLEGLQRALKGLDASDGSQGEAESRTTLLAEVRAAIEGQRKLFGTCLQLSPRRVHSTATQILQHNLQYPWEMVLTAHKAMLVSCRAAGCCCRGKELGIARVLSLGFQATMSHLVPRAA